MGNPEGGHGERKEAEYFFEELERLAEEAKQNKQPDLVVILNGLLGSMASGNIRDLTKVCGDYAEKLLTRLEHEKEQMKKRPKN